LSFKIKESIAGNPLARHAANARHFNGRVSTRGLPVLPEVVVAGRDEQVTDLKFGRNHVQG